MNPNGALYLIPTKDYPNGLHMSTNILQPRTKDEIVWIIKSVAATHTSDGDKCNRKIRVIGSGHSWSKIAKSDDIQLTLENFKVGIIPA